MNLLKTSELNDDNFNLFLSLFEDYQEKKLEEFEIKKLKNDIFNSNWFLKVFISFHDNKMVWFMFLVKSYSSYKLKDYYYLQDFFVQKNYRSKWFWTKMFEYLINFSKKNNLPRLTWMTNQKNLKAQKFYDNYDVDKTWLFYKLNIDLWK